MKKKISLTLIVLFAIVSATFGQDNFTYDQSGLKPEYLVVEIESKTQIELFKKTINWIKETYKNPDEVIKTTIDNEKVRFEGFKDNLICINSLGMIYCYYSLYTIEISFKDGRYKFTPVELEYRMPVSQYSTGGMIPINFKNGSEYYNKKGELRRMYKTIPSSIENLFNYLNVQLSTYLKKENETTESNEW